MLRIWQQRELLPDRVLGPVLDSLRAANSAADAAAAVAEAARHAADTAAFKCDPRP